MEYNIYRLRGDYSQSRGVQLPIKGKFIEKFEVENNKKISKGFKRICYIKGSDSIFVEDQKGDLKPKSLWFKFGDLRIEKNDLVGNALLQQHEWFGTKYDLWTEDLEVQSKLKSQREKSQARQIIDDADADKLKAMALAVFGEEAISYTDDKCELKLREEAEIDPANLIGVINSKNYQSRLFAGLAFTKGIVRENDAKTAVIWTDSEGVIIKLAKGENGIKELGRFLHVANEESKMVLQSIGERIEQLDTNTKEPDEKDAKIAELEAQLTAMKAGNGGGEEELNSKDSTTSDLQEARQAYKKKFQKDVPNNKKNDLNWINNRLGSE